MSLVTPLIDKHPDFEERIGKLSAQDFLTICDREGVTVSEVPSFKAKGVFFVIREGNIPMIALDTPIDPFTAFHELGHYFHGTTNGMQTDSRNCARAS